MKSGDRILAIDAFRALTMLLMIWVNDFWRLNDIPLWLEHMPADVDALGFSDIIFPAFLFIVGLSIPFAQQARIQKGDSQTQLVRHILVRSFSLIFMGVLMVNLENYGETNALLPRSIWQVLMIFGFFLVWNQYPKSWRNAGIDRYFKASGIVVLIALAVCFRSNSDSGYNWIEPYWWGILGLIGWCYLIAASIQVFSKSKPFWIAAAWLACSAITVIDQSGLLNWLWPVRNYVLIVSSGALPTLTLAGCLVSTVYLIRPTSTNRKAGQNKFVLLLAIGGILTLVLGLLLRPYWGISKINATPAWVHICTGISLLSYATLYWIVDTNNRTKWVNWIAPAGTATLTCYLAPYLAYPLLQWTGLDLPKFLATGWVGLGQSMLFAFAIVWATGGLNRLGIKLRL